MSEEEKHAEAPKKYTAKNVEPDNQSWELFHNADGSKRRKTDSK
jgi:hypothetical protein